MDYIFGYTKYNGVTVENLKTINTTHTDFSDFIQTIRNYSDATITDTFNIVDHYHSETGADGLCYDWYIINNHWRNIDKFFPEKLEALEDTTNGVILDMLADHEYRISLAEMGVTESDL